MVSQDRTKRVCERERKRERVKERGTLMWNRVFEILLKNCVRGHKTEFYLRLLLFTFTCNA